ncbi:MAG TPA: CoA transferase [Dehalococcoidia bacterium]|nr:CoA transferase [Dehalococcoidia bacterium]
MRSYRPLTGVRVLTFEAAVTLPSATRVMADLGADVVQVRRPGRAVDNFIATYDGTLINKQSILIDLRMEEGRTLALRLAAQADVVCNNFTPRVMRGFGLDYGRLRAVREDQIVMQLSGYGAPGPWADYPAYGPSVEAAGGLNSLIGNEGEVPVRIGGGVFADQLAGRYATVALLAALVHRQQTGEGQYIDLSMYEGIVHVHGQDVMAASAAGPDPARRGNRDPAIAPQGIYAAAGADEWVAISVETDEQWRALAECIGFDDASLDRVEARRERHDEIDEAIAAWARQRSKHDAAELLQSCGVIAGPVQAPRDLAVDAGYIERGHFRPIRHREPIAAATWHPHLSQLPKINGARRAPLTEAHADGADNAAVLKSWLGLDAAEVRQLHESGVTPTGIPLVTSASDVPRRGPSDADHAARVGRAHGQDAP